MVRSLTLSLFGVLTLLTSGCDVATNPAEEEGLDSQAATYVRLVLQIGQYDPDFVDAYYGPREWMPSGTINSQGALPDSLLEQIQSLIRQIDESPIPAENLDIARLQMLRKQCKAVLPSSVCFEVKYLLLTTKLKVYMMPYRLTWIPSILINC
ncbi:MAG: hypothetical protein IPL46_25125 [Saprospiraceae bacterium]|nr:hypothetical protein [Saprospiraceae bacterium]